MVDRNIPGKVLLQNPECKALCRDYLSAGGQKGVNVSNGAEQIIHSVEASRSFRPSRNILQADQVNAFNSSHRNDMLTEVKQKAKFMYAYCRKMYAAQSTLSVFSSVSAKGNVFKLTSAEGAQQGCVHGSFDYCIGTHPFLLRLANELPEQEFNEFFLAFIDDWTCSLDDESLLKTLDIMLTEGPASGLVLSREKTKVLVGHKPSDADALHLKHILTDPTGQYRLRPENVVLNPCNDSSTPWSQYGLVVLGAPVGGIEYKHAFMEDLLTKLTNEHGILQKVVDPQCKFLLLNHCFSKKLTYVLRTISPSITQAYVTDFNALIDSLLSDIMQLDADVNDPSALASSFAQSRLRINDGGLGLGLLDITPSAAYLASVVACLPTINKYEKDFIPSLFASPTRFDSQMVEDIRAAVSTINYCNYDMAMVLSLSGLNLQSGEHHDDAITTQLQHKFMEPHYEAARLSFFQSLLSLPHAAARIAQYTSVCGHEAGAAILAAPKTPALTFLPQEYRIMLRRRFHLNLLQIPDGLRCNCSSHPVIDRKGRHVVTVCHQGQGRHIIHDGFKQELASLCRYAEVYVRQEPTDVYRGVDADNGRRPDLEVRGLLERGIYGDVSITEPVTPSLTINQAKKPLRAATIVEQKKTRGYAAISQQAGYHFYPLVLETYGSWGPRLKEFFDITINHASEARGIRKDILAIYWRRRLMVSFHKSIAQAILRKVGKSKGGAFRDESNYELVPSEQLYARSG